MSVINTNITSMISQSNLNKSKGALTTAMERLSSGMRINSAKDDAAGQAIANRMTAQVKGLAQAQRNANDGISVAQTAEGALNQVNDNLQRIRELAVQSANGTNSAEDKDSIQAEIDQRLTEIDRISKETNFNGVKVLSATKTLDIQVGANDGEVISIDLKQIDKTTLKLDGFNVSGLSGAISEITTDDGAGVTTTAKLDLTTTGGTSLVATEVTLHGYGDYDAATGEYANYALKDADGNMYKADSFTVDTATGAVEITIADDDVAKTAYNTDSAAGLTSTANPLKALDDALKTVDTFRSDLGAIQNRFETAITNLRTNETNLSAARSRIEDADYAVEVANMTRAQILQQAGTSVLAQANQVPQGVLSLLR